MWTDSKQIKQQLQKLWEKGHFFTALVQNQPIFPLKLKLHKPNSSQIANQFEQVRKWVAQLQSLAEIKIEWKIVAHRIQGEQQLPESLWIENIEAVLRLLNQQQHYRQFQQIVCLTQQKQPDLLVWLAKYPFKALAVAENWAHLLAVVEWKKQHPKPNIYLRQVDIPHIHSKFIEQHQRLLAELFEAVLPADQINPQFIGNSQFCARYGFLSKPQHIRLQNLDKNCPLVAGIDYSDISLDSSTFAQLNPKIEKILIVENEVSFLALPKLPKTWAIFGSGYGWKTLAQAEWLQHCQIYYWGDIDTHGFAILNQLRHYFPHTVSILMDRATLLAYPTFWSREDKQQTGELTQLTESEQALFTALKQQQFGEKVRLEQELIPFSVVQQQMLQILGK